MSDPPERPEYESAVERLDVELGRKMASRRDSPVVQAASQAGKLGDQEPLYALAGGLTLAGLVLRDRRLALVGVRVGLAVFAADVVKSAMKRAFNRTRPHVLLDEGRYERGLGGSEEKPEQSFPSGHVAGSIAAACAIRRVYPATSRYSFIVCAGLGWSRISKGAHWPLDVAAGALAGFVAETITDRLLVQVVRRAPWPTR